MKGMVGQVEATVLHEVGVVVMRMVVVAGSLV